MNNPEYREPNEHIARAQDPHLILDGTASLDYSDDDIPQVKGLIELLNQFFVD